MLSFCVYCNRIVALHCTSNCSNVNEEIEIEWLSGLQIDNENDFKYGSAFTHGQTITITPYKNHFVQSKHAQHCSWSSFISCRSTQFHDFSMTPKTPKINKQIDRHLLVWFLFFSSYKNTPIKMAKEKSKVSSYCSTQFQNATFFSIAVPSFLCLTFCVYCCCCWWY